MLALADEALALAAPVVVALVLAELLELADEPQAAVTAAARRTTGNPRTLLTRAIPLALRRSLTSRSPGNLACTMKSSISLHYYGL
jgi:hypothetical protein